MQNTRRAGITLSFIALTLPLLLGGRALAGWQTTSNIVAVPKEDGTADDKWANKTRASDGDAALYATDKSNRVGTGAWLQLNFTKDGKGIRSNRLRVNADFWAPISSKVEIQVRYDGETEFVSVINGVVPNAEFKELALPKEGHVNAVKFRWHYVKSGYWFWLYELQLFEVEPPPIDPPQTETLEPSSVNVTSAVLSGKIKLDGGGACNTRFVYGTDPALATGASATAWTGSFGTGDEFTAFVKDLTTGTTYYYRAEVKNPEGTHVGQVKNFVACAEEGEDGSVWVSPFAWNTDSHAYGTRTYSWSDGGKAYDDWSASSARCYHEIHDPELWSPWLYLSVNSGLYNGLRFRAAKPDAFVEQIEIQVLSSEWEEVYKGGFAHDTFEVKDFSVREASQARVRFKMGKAGVGAYWNLYEFDLRKIGVNLIAEELPHYREEDPGKYAYVRGTGSPLAFKFAPGITESGDCVVNLVLTEGIKLYSDAACAQEMTGRRYDLSTEAGKLDFAQQILNKTLYVRSFKASSAERDAAVICRIGADSTTISDKVAYTFGDIFFADEFGSPLSSANLALDVGQTRTVQAIPQPAAFADKWLVENDDAENVAVAKEIKADRIVLQLTAKAQGTGWIRATSTEDGVCRKELGLRVFSFKVQGRPVFSNSPSSPFKWGWVSVGLIEVGSFTSKIWGREDPKVHALAATEGIVDPSSSTMNIPVDSDDTACALISYRSDLTDLGKVGRDFSVWLNFVVNIEGASYPGRKLFKFTELQFVFAGDDCTKDWYVSQTRNRRVSMNVPGAGGWAVKNDKIILTTQDVAQEPALTLEDKDAVHTANYWLKAVAPTGGVFTCTYTSTIHGIGLDGVSTVIIGLQETDQMPYKVEGPKLYTPDPITVFAGEPKELVVKALPTPADLGQFVVAPVVNGSFSLDALAGDGVKLEVLGRMDDASAKSEWIGGVLKHSVEGSLTYDIQKPLCPPSTVALKASVIAMEKIHFLDKPDTTFLIVGQDPVRFVLEGTSLDGSHVFNSTRVSLTATGAGAKLFGRELTVAEPGRVSVEGTAKQVENPIIQPKHWSVLRVQQDYEVGKLRAYVQFDGGADWLGVRRIPVGKTVNLSARVRAGLNDVGDEAHVVAWNTPTGTAQLYSDVPGTTEVSVEARARGVWARSPVVKVVFFKLPEPSPEPTPAPVPAWDVRLSYSTVALGSEPPQSLVSITLGTAIFKQRGGDEEFTCPFVGAGSGLSWIDVAEQFDGVVEGFAQFYSIWQTLKSALANIPFSDPYPVQVMDGSGNPTDQSAFVGVWLKVSGEAGGQGYETFGKYSEVGELRYLMNTSGSNWLTEPAWDFGFSSYYFAPSFSDMGQWMFDQVTQ